MSAANLLPEAEIYIGGVIDKGADTAKLAKRREELAKLIGGSKAKLGNEAFVSKAPPAVLEGARKQLADQQAKRAELERLLQALG